MEICKKIFFFSIFLIFFFIPITKADNLNNINLTIKDLILIKYEIFFLKNQSRVTGSKRVGLMVKYQSINYDVNIDNENNTTIRINAIMDKNRYLKKKKYKPKITDCNIIRNKIVANKFGYNPFTLKPNYSITEEILLENIKNNIFNFQNLNEDQIETLINKSTIKINIIHPIPKFNKSCSGNFSDVKLY